jgi:di/tripeptidase
MNLDEFERLKRRMDDAAETAAKAAGAAAELRKQLKRDFNAADINADRQLLKKLTADADDAERRFCSALSKFEKEYDDKIG